MQSKENPADLPTRGLTAADLELSELWWNGSAFLYEEKGEWKKNWHHVNRRCIKRSIKENNWEN